MKKIFYLILPILFLLLDSKTNPSYFNPFNRDKRDYTLSSSELEKKLGPITVKTDKGVYKLTTYKVRSTDTCCDELPDNILYFSNTDHNGPAVYVSYFAPNLPPDRPNYILVDKNNNGELWTEDGDKVIKRQELPFGLGSIGITYDVNRVPLPQPRRDGLGGLEGFMIPENLLGKKD